MPSCFVPGCWKSLRQNTSSAQKKTPQFDATVKLVVHWDSKVLRNHTRKEVGDNLPVVTSDEVEKLLGDPKLVAGTELDTNKTVEL